METLKAPDTTRGEMTRIGKSVVIKGVQRRPLYRWPGRRHHRPERKLSDHRTERSVKANVNACAVVVQGKLEGNIHASDRVDLKQSAIVVGDIATQRISIDEGAYLKGSVNIHKEAPKKEVLGGIALSPSEAAQPRKR